MKRFKGILLDVDGTLVDSNDAHARAWVEALREGGHDVSYDKVRKAIGMGSDNLLPNTVGVEKDSEEGKKLIKRWEEIFTERYQPHLKAFPRSKELLQQMKDSGYKLVVASSAKKDQLEVLLKIAGADKIVDEETSSDDAKRSKPNPDIIEVALDKLGYPAEEAVMLGDTPYDIESAAKAGVKTIAFRCGGWQDADLKGAIGIYDNPADLLSHFDSSPLGNG